MGNFHLGITQAFSVNWETFGHIFEGMYNLPTEIHSVDDVTFSIQAFGNSLHNAFQEVAKSRQRGGEEFQLPKNIKVLERERNRLKRHWQTTRDQEHLLKSEPNRKNRQVCAAIEEFSISAGTLLVESLPASNNIINWQRPSSAGHEHTYRP